MSENVRGKYTIAIDLGENQVVAVAGYKNRDNKVVISAIAERETQGLVAGRIENIAQINESLSGVIAELERELNVEIQRAYGGIAGDYIRCEHHTETIMIKEPGSGVAQSDVANLHSLMRSVLAPDTDTIMESKVEYYMVDGKDEIKNPVGTFGQTISAAFNFVIGGKEVLKRLNLAFIQAGISMNDCYSNAVVAAEAVLTNDEKEAGVALVDLGRGVTNVAIYSRGTLRHIVSIPMGGSAINRDLTSLMIKERNVEEVKCENGCAIATLAKNGTITVAGRTPREKRTIPIYNIAVAIEQRLADIIAFIEREIHDAGYEGRLPYGVVLTGGGANMPEIDELFRRSLSLDIRIAAPEEGIADESKDLVLAPEYATVIGILGRGIEKDAKDSSKSCTIVIGDAPIEEEEEEIENEEIEAESESAESPKTTTYKSKDSNKDNISATQTSLNLDDEEEDEDEEEEYEEENKENPIKKFLDKLNNLFSSNGDTKL